MCFSQNLVNLSSWLVSSGVCLGLEMKWSELLGVC